jgi:hypothetical protein
MPALAPGGVGKIGGSTIMGFGGKTSGKLPKSITSPDQAAIGKPSTKKLAKKADRKRIAALETIYFTPYLRYYVGAPVVNFQVRRDLAKEFCDKGLKC